MPGSWSDFLKLRSGPAPPPSSEAGAVRVYADTGGALRSVQSDGTDAPIGGGGGSLPDPITDPVTITLAEVGGSPPDALTVTTDDGHPVFIVHGYGGISGIGPTGENVSAYLQLVETDLPGDLVNIQGSRGEAIRVDAQDNPRTFLRLHSNFDGPVDVFLVKRTGAIETQTNDVDADPFTVFDAGGNAVFAVQADGSVHIKTGTTIQADL